MKPNIIVFMTDQQNARTIGKDGTALTPNTDKFLKDATHFTEAYTCSPHCCPSRASFFTGLYPSEHGVWNNVETDNALSRGVFDNITMFPEILKESGYYNVFSGKWHVSALEGPLDRGFDKVLREYVSNYGRTTSAYVPRFNEWKYAYAEDATIDGCEEEKGFGRIIRPGYPTYYQFGIDENPFGDTDSVTLACDEIAKYDGEEPLFMYVGATGPHDPYCPPQEFLDMYDIKDIVLPDSFEDEMLDKPALYRRTKAQFNLTTEEHKESLRRYLAFTTYEDYLFGKLLQSIDDKGIRENTVIIYLTDHGDYNGAHGLWAKGLPCFKEAYNICAAISGPGYEKGVQCNEFVSIADFAPTILEMVQSEKQESMTGKSLVPLLKNHVPENWSTEVYTQTNGNEIYGIQRAVWNKEWKYVYNSFDYDELYHISEDPNEMENIATKEENKDIIKEMCKKLWKFSEKTHDGATCGYIMVGLAPFGPGIIRK